ncbi:MAG: DUF2970 domain-containing protein [Burkholderiales bacterium]|nr:DUF2970 domain-containing protein [Burkholderiales bacterium]
MSAADKPSFGRSLRMVAWGFLGVRKRSSYQQDLAQVNPLHLVLAALIGAVLFVLLLLGLANWAASGG